MTLLIDTYRIPAQSMEIAIKPKGAIEADDAYLLRDRFIMVLAATEPERIVVDLSAVPSISPAGVDALESGYRKAAAQDAHVLVVETAPQVEEQLRRNGMGELMIGEDPDL